MRGLGGEGETLQRPHQGRQDVLEEPTGPLLIRDGRERMEGRVVLDVQCGVLEAVTSLLVSWGSTIIH